MNGEDQKIWMLTDQLRSGSILAGPSNSKISASDGMYCLNFSAGTLSFTVFFKAAFSLTRRQFSILRSQTVLTEKSTMRNPVKRRQVARKLNMLMALSSSCCLLLSLMMIGRTCGILLVFKIGVLVSFSASAGGNWSFTMVLLVS